MLNTADIIAFIGATDAARTRQFYGDKLGLDLIREEPGHALVFQAGATILRVSLVQELPGAQFTVLGWKVKDIEKTVDELAGRGVVFQHFPGFTQDEKGIWTTVDGARVAWFKDPDGNLLSLTQFPAA